MNNLKPPKKVTKLVMDNQKLHSLIKKKMKKTWSNGNKNYNSSASGTAETRNNLHVHLNKLHSSPQSLSINFTQIAP